MTAGRLVSAADVPAREAGQGASARVLVETEPDGSGLTRRLTELVPGGRIEGLAGRRGRAVVRARRRGPAVGGPRPG